MPPSLPTSLEPYTWPPGHNVPPTPHPNGCTNAPPSAPGLLARDRSGPCLLFLRVSPLLPTSSAYSLPTSRVALVGADAPTADGIPASVPVVHLHSTHGLPPRTNTRGKAGASSVSANGHKATAGPSYPMSTSQPISTTLPGNTEHSGLPSNWSSLPIPRTPVALSAAWARPQRSTS